MKRQVVFAAYIGFWLAVASAAIYFGGSLGLPWWKSFAVTYLLFLGVNGSLAYMSMRHRLKSEGKAPSAYLVYLFFPKGVPFANLPPTVRIPLGVVILLGGLIAVAMSIDLLFNPPERTLSVVASIVVLLVAGPLFTYMGFRLVVARDGA